MRAFDRQSLAPGNGFLTESGGWKRKKEERSQRRARGGKRKKTPWEERIRSENDWEKANDLGSLFYATFRLFRREVWSRRISSKMRNCSGNHKLNKFTVLDGHELLAERRGAVSGIQGFTHKVITFGARTGQAIRNPWAIT
jgi:hypothetical protein